MKTLSPLPHLLLVILLSCGTMLFAGSKPAQAALDPMTLTSDINDLVRQGDDLVQVVNQTVLVPFTSAAQLANIETDAVDLRNGVLAVYDTIIDATGTSMPLDNEILTSLQDLSRTMASLSQAAMGLSGQLGAIANSGMGASFTSMLRLSDDIGVMANRILEMADKILVMADNIGLMADRILETQVIQSNNLELVLDATLQTQRNMITLIELFAL